MKQRTLVAIASLAVFTLGAEAACWAQEGGDYFEDIVRQNADEHELDVSGGDSAENEQSGSSVTLTPFQVSFEFTHDTNDGDFPAQLTSQLTPSQTIMDGVQVQQGAFLKLENAYYVPPGSLFRKVWLHSTRETPNLNVSNTAREFVAGTDFAFVETWEPSDRFQFESSANIRKAMKLKRTPNDFGEVVGETGLIINTGNLKPGDYQVEMFIFRREDGERIDKRTQTFDFEVVERPLRIEAVVPVEMAARPRQTWDGGQGYPIYISDWAVAPLRLELTTDHAGIEFEAGGDLIANAGDVFYHALNIDFGAEDVDKEAKFTVVVTDAIGRSAQSTHSIFVDGDALDRSLSDADLSITLSDMVELPDDNASSGWQVDLSDPSSSSNNGYGPDYQGAASSNDYGAVSLDEDFEMGELIDTQTIEVETYGGSSSSRNDSSGSGEICGIDLANSRWRYVRPEEPGVPGQGFTLQANQNSDGVYEALHFNDHCDKVHEVVLNGGRAYTYRQWYSDGTPHSHFEFAHKGKQTYNKEYNQNGVVDYHWRLGSDGEREFLPTGGR